MAHKKGGGSTRNGRDSKAKRLGVKVFGDAAVNAGGIINVSIEVDLGTGPRVLAGFENHGGRTYLGSGAEPLGRVLHGHGNNGKDGFEGVLRENLIGTYLHGPLLPKNAWLADELIARAVEHSSGTRPALEPLDDALEDAAHAGAEAAARRG